MILHTKSTVIGTRHIASRINILQFKNFTAYIMKATLKAIKNHSSMGTQKLYTINSPTIRTASVMIIAFILVIVSEW